MTLRDAFLHVKGARNNIGPNNGFMKKLIAYDIKLYCQKSFDLEEYYLSALMNMGFNETKAKDAMKYACGSFNIALNFLLADS